MVWNRPFGVSCATVSSTAGGGAGSCVQVDTQTMRQALNGENRPVHFFAVIVCPGMQGCQQDDTRSCY